MNQNRPTVQARDAQLIAGIQKHLQNAAPIGLDGTAYAPADLIKLFQSEIDAVNAAVSMRGTYKDAVTLERNVRAQVRRLRVAFQQFVRLLYGAASSKLADFGLAPTKTPKRTPTTSVTAAAKSKATRTARHTMGPKKKLAVKGTIEVPAPTSAPSPAQAGGSNGSTASASNGAAPQAVATGAATHTP
jgi:hypothetical protein